MRPLDPFSVNASAKGKHLFTFVILLLWTFNWNCIPNIKVKQFLLSKKLFILCDELQCCAQYREHPDSLQYRHWFSLTSEETCDLFYKRGSLASWELKRACFWDVNGNRKRTFRVLGPSPTSSYYSSLMERRYLVMRMWLCEGKLKVKMSHFQLPSAPQKRACLKSRL